MPGPALGMVELASIARGVITADAMLKQAPVALVLSRPVSGGKHIIAVWGEVAEVEEAMGAARATAGALLVDSLFLPMADGQLAPLLSDAPPVAPPTSDAVAVVETHTVCAAVLAADAAAKAADVQLLELRLAVGIAGKGYFTMTGELPSLEAAAEAARGALGEGLLVAIEIIPAPHDDLRARLIF